MDSERTAFGKPMLKHWLFDPAYKCSYGAHPAPVRDVQRSILDQADRRPDPYLRMEHYELLEDARHAVAQLLNAPTDECVFVKNATTGVATVFYNLNFQPGDSAIIFETVYGAVEKGLVSLQERSSLQTRKVRFEYPIPEQELLARFREVIQQTRDEGLKVRAAVFDTIVSNPGVRFPFEKLTVICREEGILSVIDGAHGIGQIPLDMRELRPDFFVSNCHKWLYTPRSAAVLYVPKSNQHLIRTTLPTSWGFIPVVDPSEATISASPHPGLDKPKTAFEELFQFVATSDDSAYLCVPAAVKFRRDVCGGEEAVHEYCIKLAHEAADAVASILGTKVMQEPGLKPGEISNMRNCAMATVSLPVGVSDNGSTEDGALVTLAPEEAVRASVWMTSTLLTKFNTYVPIFRHGPWLWTRLSAQIYLEKGDFQWLAGVLQELCDRVARKEF
ncbi:L-cysteine desulfhydrase-like protein lolT1 [Penicillium diatomitis]|uniref:L-cysteine desulfhydrase-like protein lolT1 n=1 Tax=Penicillium diatomitis TaxID=2819901 RepID=A0A9X0C3B1_9EURO|nr:L-cysteine desulfhydrase-like protein lolT1 [Penicillium diatomitis]KAJ5496015.1 L-cysteine desulfhydrase-like protein lolT1 [Penicillium diatomitis]